MTKQEAYELGKAHAHNNIYLPYNMEDEILAEYERGYDEVTENV